MMIRNLSIAVAAILFSSSSLLANTMESIEARIGLGTAPDLQGFAGFFENGFTQGDLSHTDTLSFDDGVVRVDFDITVEAFEETGGPAGLRTTSSAVGVDGSGDTVSESTRIDTGEQIKVTFNDISYSVIGVPPVGFVDESSFESLISSLKFAAFESGVDTYTYAGVGAGAVTGDDTDTIDFVPWQSLSNGDMFTVTADSGAFRGLFISMSANYSTIVPEPTTLCLGAMASVALLFGRKRG